MSTTRITHRVNAPRPMVYRALLDAKAVATWMVPPGMTSHVHAFDGRFVKLVPNEQVVDAVEFETAAPALQGEMTITYTLADADGGTDVLGVHDGLPPGVPSADNEAGWRESLAKLAALVESRANCSETRADPLLKSREKSG